jgi:phosphatidylserine decarboxylase
MNQDQVTLLLIKGAIADLPDSDRKGIELAAAKLREIITLHNDHGRMAMALVGAELAAQE